MALSLSAVFSEAVDLFWSSMTGLTKWLGKTHQDKSQFRPTDIIIAFTNSPYQIDSVVFQYCVSVYFVLFWVLRW